MAPSRRKCTLSGVFSAPLRRLRYHLHACIWLSQRGPHLRRSVGAESGRCHQKTRQFRSYQSQEKCQFRALHGLGRNTQVGVSYFRVSGSDGRRGKKRRIHGKTSPLSDDQRGKLLQNCQLGKGYEFGGPSASAASQQRSQQRTLQYDLLRRLLGALFVHA